MPPVETVLGNIPWSGDGKVAHESCGKKYFATADVEAAYWNMSYHPSCQRLFGTVIELRDAQGRRETRYFLHRQLVMGWCNSAQWWTYGLGCVLKCAFPEEDIYRHISYYMDDILVFHETEERCSWIMDMVAYALSCVGCTLPEHKRCGPAESVEFLSIRLSSRGWCPNQRTVEDVLRLLREPPTTVGGLRSKVGTLSYARALFASTKAVSCISAVLSPFTDLQGKHAKSKRSTKLNLSEELQGQWRHLISYCNENITSWHAPKELLGHSLMWVLCADTSEVATCASLWRAPRRVLDTVKRDGDEALKSVACMVWSYSHKLSASERNWANWDRELYGIFRGLYLVKNLVIGSYGEGAPSPHLLVLTDNTAALSRVANRPLPVEAPTVQKARWLNWYTLTSDYEGLPIVYAHGPGSTNFWCDLFSRLVDGDDLDSTRDWECHSWPLIPTRVGDFVLVSLEEEENPFRSLDEELPFWCIEITALYEQDVDTSLEGRPLQQVYDQLKSGALSDPLYEVDDLGLLWRLSPDEKRLVVPKGLLSRPLVEHVNAAVEPHLRKELMAMAHGCGGHHGIRRTTAALREYVWWPGMNRDIQDYVRSCIVCWSQRLAPSLDQPPNPRQPSGSVSRFEAVALDFGHPPPHVRSATQPDAKAFLVCVDVVSNFMVAVATPGERAVDVSQALLGAWLPYFGLFSHLLSDRGPAFSSQLARTLGKALGWVQHFSCVYNPRGNGLAEKCVGLLKEHMARHETLPWDISLKLGCFLHNHHAPLPGSPAPAMIALGMKSPRLPLALTFERISQEALEDEVYPELIEEVAEWHRKELREGKWERATRSRFVSTSPADGDKVVCLTPGTLVTWRPKLEIAPAEAVVLPGVREVPYRQLSLRHTGIDADRILQGGWVGIGNIHKNQYSVAKFDNVYALVKILSDPGTDEVIRTWVCEQQGGGVVYPLVKRQRDDTSPEFRYLKHGTGIPKGFVRYTKDLDVSAFVSDSFELTPGGRIPASARKKMEALSITSLSGGS
ncbi:hypothetical protein FOZ62_028152 [Perkinsus olseni]|uniref:Integrase catalytic domain-containing protein n=1 Tax=Perkinsus olseni TaxID=32597 RepID=A0A7J6T820_PEROL|nr:hypothetical protein FOZ62_028152 [Perkinsus olseni]